MSNALFLKCFNMMSVEHSTWISVRKVIWHLIYMFIRIFMIFVHRSKKIPGGIHYSALERLPMIQNRTVLYLGFQSRNVFLGNHEKGRSGENLRWEIKTIYIFEVIWNTIKASAHRCNQNRGCPPSHFPEWSVLLHLARHRRILNIFRFSIVCIWPCQKKSQQRRSSVLSSHTFVPMALSSM